MITASGPSTPAAAERAVPAHFTPSPAHSIVADAFDQLDAPATVGATFAPAPGDPAGGTTGSCCSCCSDLSAGVLPPSAASLSETNVVFAFPVDFPCTSGTITDASGPDEAPEFVTAWQPPVVPSHDPVPYEPRGSTDTLGSVPDAALDTVPVHAFTPSQASAAPAADAADGPATTGPTCFAGSAPASARAAPGPVNATEVAAAEHVLPAVHDAVPVEVRGPPVVVSNPVELVVTVPVQPFGQSRFAVALDVLDGPVSG
ncbi:hypothetical protein WEH80_36655 [Actinomycetes bacterium KLBMP 9759]